MVEFALLEFWDGDSVTSLRGPREGGLRESAGALTFCSGTLDPTAGDEFLKFLCSACRCRRSLSFLFAFAEEEEDEDFRTEDGPLIPSRIPYFDSSYGATDGFLGLVFLAGLPLCFLDDRCESSVFAISACAEFSGSFC